jgi:two-component system NtrC family sensor kinase
MNEEVKILCVDDESSVLKALERLFLDEDYEIITASSGEEGIEILKETESIRLIISDYRMPGMNGVDFLKIVYKLRPETIRIVLSGYADTAAIVEAINEGGIYKFIPKPWNDDELKITISNALDHYFAQQKNILLTRVLEAKNDELREINFNLEKVAGERTTQLIEHDIMLVRFQSILDALPVGVIGIAPEGLIVQCNRKVLKLLGKRSEDLIGTDRNDSFTEDVNRFIEEVIQKGIFSGNIISNGTDIRVKGVYMKPSQGEEGIILALEEVNADE